MDIQQSSGRIQKLFDLLQSQNCRTLSGKGPQGSPGPASWQRRNLDKLSQYFIHLNFKILQWWGIYPLFPGEIIAVADCSHCENFFSCVKLESPPVFSDLLLVKRKSPYSLQPQFKHWHIAIRFPQSPLSSKSSFLSVFHHMAACPVICSVVAFHWTLSSLSTLLFLQQGPKVSTEFQVWLTSAEWSGITTSLFLLVMPLQCSPACCWLSTAAAHCSLRLSLSICTPSPFSTELLPGLVGPSLCCTPCFLVCLGFLYCTAYTQDQGLKLLEEAENLPLYREILSSEAQLTQRLFQRPCLPVIRIMRTILLPQFVWSTTVFNLAFLGAIPQVNQTSFLGPLQSSLASLWKHLVISMRWNDQF